MKNIGRNSPCPCRSGKKYKKCCLEKEIINKTIITEDHYLPINIIFDYGKANLNDKFFKKNKIEELSSFRFLHMSIAPGFYEVVDDYAKKSNISNRSIGEVNVINSTNNVNDLLKILDDGIDPLNHKILIDKILLFKDEAIPLILDSLNNEVSDEILELLIKIILFSKIDCSDKIVDLILNGNRRAYVVATLCFLLGNIKNKKSTQILWDHFHYFNDNFYDESYSDGPLLGLLEIFEKY